MKNSTKTSIEYEADICLICEGSYPFLMGGVAQWVHELITEHAEKTFHIISLEPPNPSLKPHYVLPKNVTGHTVYIVQDLQAGASARHTPKELWTVLEKAIQDLFTRPDCKDLSSLLNLSKNYRSILGKSILFESVESWEFICSLYDKVIPLGPFKAYFASAYTLIRALFSLLLPPLPKARLYHSVCTGYAGLILHRAKEEEKKPCILTEHGIYSNERRIEIAAAEWITEVDALNLAIEDKKKKLKDFWVNVFLSLANICYKSADAIITTFDGNQEVQIEGGADPEKMETIVHGIKIKKDAHIEPRTLPDAPMVTFIGRIVPIKDIKTFIRACSIVKAKAPHVQFQLLGPMNEDPIYAAECRELVKSLGLEESLIFKGGVRLHDYFPKVDLVVLTSISETQPLVMLEAGAFAIPAVATRVGGCEQILSGSNNESPHCGVAGLVTPLVDSEATAEAILKMVTDKEFYHSCSQAILNRIETHYRFDQQHKRYRELYNQYIS
jgi:polysaccharide biosynthesis protein PelF